MELNGFVWEFLVEASGKRKMTGADSGTFFLSLLAVKETSLSRFYDLFRLSYVTNMLNLEQNSIYQVPLIT